MAENEVPQIDGDELRRVAEVRLGEKLEANLRITENPLRLLHELQVHQIELELQNTELRQARSEVETTLEKYTNLYEFAPVGYVTLDHNGTIRAANLTGSSLMGVDRSKLIGQRFGRFISDKNRSVFADFLEKVFTSQSKETCEVTFLKEGNSELIVRIDGVTVASEEECHIALIDITEREQAKAALLASERRYSALFANKINGMAHCRIITNKHGQPIDYIILQINEAYERIIGIKKADIENHRVKEVFPEIENYELDYIGIYGKIALEGGEIKFEEFFEATLQHLSIYAYCPLPGEFIAIFTDVTEHKLADEALKKLNAELEVRVDERTAHITSVNETLRIEIVERKLAEEALQQAIEVAEAANRAKSQFLANMSHELRTPMTGVLGMLQIALREDLAPAPRDHVETALTSARSLLRILNDILDMAKIEAGKLTIEEKPFSLQGCLAEAVDIITPEVRYKGLDFAILMATVEQDTVIGDQARLRQILLNLIGNAVKFTEVGKVEVQITAGEKTFDGKREFSFVVTDTGIGIPYDKKELLFQTFSQVDASHTRIYGGAGLGLAICKELVELMGGTIRFESEEEVGSSFSFTVPLGEARLESDAISATESLTCKTITSQEGERIPHLLLVEDDPNNRKALGLLLKWANYSLDFAEDGLMAVEMWERGEYDLVLMDIQMPRLNGFEATRAIREKERERGGHTPIIAMTAHAFKEDEERCLAAGMDAFIAKPIDINKCKLLIGQIIKQKSCGVNWG